MEHMGLFTKYAGEATIGLGLGVAGMSGKKCKISFL